MRARVHRAVPAARMLQPRIETLFNVQLSGNMHALKFEPWAPSHVRLHLLGVSSFFHFKSRTLTFIICILSFFQGLRDLIALCAIVHGLAQRRDVLGSCNHFVWFVGRQARVATAAVSWGSHFFFNDKCRRPIRVRIQHKLKVLWP